MNNYLNLIFELCINLFQGIMFVGFCYRFLTPRYKVTVNRVAYCLAVVLMFISITAINYFHITFSYIEIFAFFIIMIPYCTVFFKDKLYIRVLTPLSVNVLYSMLSFGLNYFFTAVFDCDYSYLMAESTSYRYMYVILSNLIFLAILFMLYHLFKNQLFVLKTRDAFLSLIIPIASIVASTLTFFAASNSQISNSSRVILGLVSIIILSFTFLNFYMVKSISKNYALQNENIVISKEKELYRLEIENFEKYINDISAIKHDIKNQLFCIESLIDEHKYSEAAKMCSDINTEINSVGHIYKTGNVYLDAILNTVHAKAKKTGINLSVNCNTNLSFVQGDDLSILIGNLVDNAIEALANEIYKELKISIFQKGGYAILNVKNFCSRSVLQTNPNLVSNKPDSNNHGYGLKSVRKIVGKYGGDIAFYEQDNYFYVSIVLEMPNAPE